MQVDIDYITNVLHAIDVNLEDVNRGLAPSGYLTINSYLEDMRYRLSEITNEILTMEV
jgi:hypothetical protein